jgi:hypothetical protein
MPYNQDNGKCSVCEIQLATNAGMCDSCWNEFKIMKAKVQRRSMLKSDLINMLQNEIKYINESELDDKTFENYSYTIKGDLSEKRCF